MWGGQYEYTNETINLFAPSLWVRVTTSFCYIAHKRTSTGRLQEFKTFDTQQPMNAMTSTHTHSVCVCYTHTGGSDRYLVNMNNWTLLWHNQNYQSSVCYCNLVKSVYKIPGTACLSDTRIVQSMPQWSDDCMYYILDSHLHYKVSEAAAPLYSVTSIQPSLS